MGRLKYYINVFFSSYTIASLVVALANFRYYETEFGIEWLFQMALLCLVISFLMFITDMLSEKVFGNVPIFIFILIGVLEVSACVMLMGGLWYQWFPLSIDKILEIFVIDTVIYFAVFGIMFFQEKKSADSINRIIKNGRNKNGKNH